jgi:hypothetical protein
MRVTFDYRNANQAHVDVAVFVNGAQAGILRMRRVELSAFRRIVKGGCSGVDAGDFFVEIGNASPINRRFGDPPYRDYSVEWTK